MSLARKGASVFFSNWLRVPIQLAIGVLVVRVVGAEGKGVLVILTTGISLLATLGHLGFPAAAIYFVRRRIYNERTLLANYSIVIIVVGLLSAGLLFLASDFFIAVLLQGTSVSPGLICLVLAGVPLSMAFTFISSIQLANGQTNEYAQLVVGASVLNLIGTLILVVVFRLGVLGALTAILLSQLIMAAIFTRTILVTTRGQACEVHPRVFIALLKFGVQQHIASVGSLIFKRFDSFLLAYFLDVAAVGYYSVAYTAYDTVLSIPRAVNPLLAGEASGRDTRNAASFVARTTRNVFWIMLSAIVVLAIASPWLIPLVYGPDFAQSVAPLVILLIAALLVGLSANLQSYFLGIGKPGFNGVFTLVAGVANLGFSLWLIPAAGIVGNAVATLLGSVILALLPLFWFSRLSGISIRLVLLLTAQDQAAWRRQAQDSLCRLRLLFRTAIGG